MALIDWIRGGAIMLLCVAAGVLFVYTLAVPEWPALIALKGFRKIRKWGRP